MFGQLPKLFDRDFAIAFFLPAMTFVMATYLLAWRFDFLENRFSLSSESFLRDLAAFGTLSLLWAVILLIANRLIIRFLEGYWPSFLSSTLRVIELYRFRRLRTRDTETDSSIEKLEAEGKTIPDKLQHQRDSVRMRLADRFPDEEGFILPTSFGNTMRAFEAYPRVMYGIDAIPGWFRLMAVIPKEYRSLMDSARVPVDFWANLSVQSLLVIAEFYAFARLAGRLHADTLLSTSADFPWIPVFATISFLVAYSLARRAVEQWGNWVKSAFDLYLPDLRKRLNFVDAESEQKDRDIWDDFNVAVLIRRPAWMPNKVGAWQTSPTAKDLSEQLRTLDYRDRLLVLERAFRSEPEKPHNGQDQAKTDNASGGEDA